MQPFRVHGHALSTPAPCSVPAFGRRPLRRYGHAAAPRSQPAPVPDEDEAFPWVDQEFEEYFFE